MSGLTILNNITTCTSSLNVSGLTILNNAITCRSSLNVSGTTTLINFVGIGNNGPFNSYGIFDVGGDNINTYYSFLNKFASISIMSN